MEEEAGFDGKKGRKSRIISRCSGANIGPEGDPGPTEDYARRSDWVRDLWAYLHAS